MDYKADILIQGGAFFSMIEGEEPRPADIAIRDGKIAAVLPPGTAVEAVQIFDAAGLFVTPGFVDSHMHDEYFIDPDTVQHALIRQGVTTAVGGHCGSGPPAADSFAARPKPWLHLGYMVGNCMLREAVGRVDRYTPSGGEEIDKMCGLLRESMESGAMGLSLGLEYAPGASYQEISELAAVASKYPNSFMSVHIRYDDKRCVDAVREVISVARENNIRLQISHLGSMSMGRTRKCTDIIAEAAAGGQDVGIDCYPYDAFCAKAASAVYDDTFVERWDGKGPEYLEAASGRFKGQRLTFETLAIMRKEEPTGLIIAHVMDADEVAECVAHPLCVVASDALYNGGGSHPRVAGTFPRALSVLREKGYDWQSALRKVTSMPADRLNIKAGRLAEGSVADVVVFDPENFKDKATFHDPFLTPDGLRLVVINGGIVLKDNLIGGTPRGDIIRRS